MLCEVAVATGWTDSHMLAMPARRFFALLGGFREFRAAEKIEQCDIAAIPVYTKEYHIALAKRYELQLKNVKPADPIKIKKKAPDERETFNQMRGLFGGR